LGAKVYFCPVRSVSITRAPIVIEKHVKDKVVQALGPEKDMLNDVVYGDYHLLRSELRILTDAVSSDPTPQTPR
jgi:hypothetical protein